MDAATTTAAPSWAFDKQDHLVIGGVLILAAALRLLFFRGIVSNDEFNHLRRTGEVWKGRFERGVLSVGCHGLTHTNCPTDPRGMIRRIGTQVFTAGRRHHYADGRYLVDFFGDFQGSQLARRRRQFKKLLYLAGMRIGV